MKTFSGEAGSASGAGQSDAIILDVSGLSWRFCCAWCNGHPTFVVTYIEEYEYIPDSGYGLAAIHHKEIRQCRSCQQLTRINWDTPGTRSSVPNIAANRPSRRESANEDNTGR
jgi:hypothetical protein